MTIPTFDPPIAPEPGLTTKPEIKLLKAEFGDGYTQTTGDGINHIRAVVELSWPVLYPDEAEEIIGFLDERGGFKPFHYTLPGDALPIKFTCEQWEEKRNGNGFRSISATFRQTFALGG